MYAGRVQRTTHATRYALVASNAQLTPRDVRRSRPTHNSRHEMYAGRVQRTSHATRCTLVASNAHLTPRDVRRSRPTDISRHEIYAGRVQRTSHATRCTPVASNAHLTPRDVRRSGAVQPLPGRLNRVVRPTVCCRGSYSTLNCTRFDTTFEVSSSAHNSKVPTSSITVSILWVNSPRSSIRRRSGLYSVPLG